MRAYVKWYGRGGDGEGLLKERFNKIFIKHLKHHELFTYLLIRLHVLNCTHGVERVEK